VNRVLKRTMEINTPRVNSKIMNGTASEILDAMPAYLDEFFRSGLRSLSDKINFNYLGYRRMAPLEEYKTMVARNTGAVVYDLSHSNVYVVEFRFEYEGVVINRPIYLPYATEGNILVMGGATYHITPVLSDTVITPSESGVFMRLLKAKLNFTSRSRYFIVNGNKVTGNVIYGNILTPNTKQVVDNIGHPLISTALYLFGKFGLSETLKKYGGADDVIVTNDPMVIPDDGYVVYETSGVKPRGLKLVPYIPHNVRIMVKGDKLNRAYVDNVVFGAIYTLDILPDIETDLVNIFNSNDTKTEIAFWRITLGRVIYKNSFSIDRIAQDLDEHYVALEGYVDDLIRVKLAESGNPAKTFFDLLAMIMTKYSSWVLSSKEYNSNIENRYIDILYYLTCDIIIGFNRIILSLNKRITKTSEISYKEVSKILGNELGSRRVYNLTKSTEPNLAITGVECSCDIRYPKVTSVLEDRLVLSV